MKHQKSLVRALALGALVLAGGLRTAAAGDDIVLYACNAVASNGAWTRVTDASAAGGARMASADAGAAKLSAPLASPASYFEATFTVKTGVAYHLWIRGKAQDNSWTNDSVFVQFSGSVTSSGSAAYRIGSTAATIYSLEAYSGAGESGWGWEDNGYGQGVLGPSIYFNDTSQTIRIQSREDGLSIDQIVLSPVTYASQPPGLAKDDATILPESTGASSTTAAATGTSSTAVSWINAVNASASGGTLKKTSGCSDCYDAGAVSQQQLSSGSVSFTVPTGQKLFVGLSKDTSTNTSYNIDYAFKFTGASGWEVRESNVYRKEGTFSSSDVFSITDDGTTIKYFRNGSLVYTSLVAVSGALVLDTSISTVGATVSSASVSGSTTTVNPPPAPPPPSSGGSLLRVLQWNIHHGGYGTDGVYSPDRIATWVQKMNPDVVMFNEIEKNDSWGNQDQPEVYKALLQQKTGATWYYIFAQEFGQWSANGKGNIILSRYPIRFSDRYELVHNADRSIAEVEISVNAIPITFVLTHLDPYDATLRLAQAKEVTGWSAVQPENRILTGDMNAWPDQTSIAHYNTLYYDSWTVALAKGTAVAFSGNNGETKNGRIDYIFYSKSSTNLFVKSSQVYDTRDANGVMPSDHRPVLTVFEVR